MKQVLQELNGGATIVADVPAPLSRPGHLRISTSTTLVSSGTERMLADFARKSLASKALDQPQRVGEVLQKVRSDGLLPTVDAVRTKLEQQTPLGYCNVGTVVEAGLGAEGFAKGDRVVSNGRHAEVVVVPWTLCARVPDVVSDESAAFTVLGAIALQSIRLAAPTLGEAFVVTGLGIIGLLAVQMLRANGCRVLGIDMSSDRVELARAFGAETVDLSRGEDPLAKAELFSRGRGVDGVLLTLDSKSDDPVAQAAKMCRKRGRIVLTGVTGLSLDRNDFYEKELTFQVSCSYGPGRYDPAYEEKGIDYPYGFVRWTEQRNFEAILDLMTAGTIDTRPLITHRFDIDAAADAYNLLTSKEKALGILLQYPARSNERLASTVALPTSNRNTAPGRAAVGFIGAGGYGGRILVDAFEKTDATLHTLSTSMGVSAAHHGRRAGFRFASTDADALFHNKEIDTVCIATRHDSHTSFVLKGIAAGKNIFVEKPLCLTLNELSEIETALGTAASAPLLMVGFNRRFAPLVVEAKALTDTVEGPKVMIMTVNAGAIAASHWVQEPGVGGGRIIGEGCHFIDLLRYFAGHPITSFQVAKATIPGAAPLADTVSITLNFADGSLGLVHYLSNGNKDFPKERLEIFCSGRILALDNYRSLTGYGWPRFSSSRAWRADKGQGACVAAFVNAIKTGSPSPIPPSEIFEVSRVTIEAAARAE